MPAPALPRPPLTSEGNIAAPPPSLYAPIAIKATSANARWTMAGRPRPGFETVEVLEDSADTLLGMFPLSKNGSSPGLLMIA